MKSIKKGFTLVEVLIVVVIIAILASLIVPRMLMQTEKAKAAEAMQAVGIIKRAAERLYDFSGSFNIPSQYNSIYTYRPGMGTNTGDFVDLGVTGMEKSQSWDFHYWVTGTGTGMGIRASNNSPDGTYNAMVYTYPPNALGSWACSGVFKAINATANHPDNSDIGCTI